MYVFLVSGARHSSNCKNARDLKDCELSLQLTKAKGSKGESVIQPFYVHPLLAKSLGETGESNPETFQHYRDFNYTVYGKRGCPDDIEAGSRELMDISLCPWNVEINYEKHRYPRTLLHARCRCEQCVKIPKYKSITSETMCKAITIKERVLRRRLSPSGLPICEDGKVLYDAVWEDIPIACACVMRVAEQS